MSSEKSATSGMQHIPPSSLTTVPSRLAFTKSFLNFTEADGNAIHASGPLIAPLMQAVLDAIYTKLLGFDITAKAFVPKTEAEGTNDTELKCPQELHLHHAHIRRQMNFLQNYLLKIVRTEDWTPNSKLWIYMDQVAVAHTGLPGFAHRAKRQVLRVEYMHLALLLGYVEDVVVGAVMGMDGIDLEMKSNIVRAWNKLLWLQNDLFARRYVVDRDTGEMPTGLDIKGKLDGANIVALLLLGVAAGMLLMYTLG